MKSTGKFSVFPLLNSKYWIFRCQSFVFMLIMHRWTMFQRRIWVRQLSTDWNLLLNKAIHVRCSSLLCLSYRILRILSSHVCCFCFCKRYFSVPFVQESIYSGKVPTEMFASPWQRFAVFSVTFRINELIKTQKITSIVIVCLYVSFFISTFVQSSARFSG